MAKVKRPYGFGGVDQVAEFLDLPVGEVASRAENGEWPSYVIAGRRVFDIDELLRLLVDRGNQKTPATCK